MARVGDEDADLIANAHQIGLPSPDSHAISNLASAVFVLTWPIGFGPMSIPKDPKGETDEQASLQLRAAAK